MKSLSSAVSCAVLAASLALTSSALAAPAASSAPAAATQTPAAAAATQAPAAATQTPATAAGAQAAASAGVDASVTVGMAVKDSTGASIGQVTALNPDASGKNMATIKMGTQSFAIDASSLSVQGGAATVNATKAQIEKMLPKS